MRNVHRHAQVNNFKYLFNFSHLLVHAHTHAASHTNLLTYLLFSKRDAFHFGNTIIMPSFCLVFLALCLTKSRKMKMCEIYYKPFTIHRTFKKKNSFFFVFVLFSRHSFITHRKRNGLRPYKRWHESENTHRWCWFNYLVDIFVDVSPFCYIRIVFIVVIQKLNALNQYFFCFFFVLLQFPAFWYLICPLVFPNQYIAINNN